MKEQSSKWHPVTSSSKAGKRIILLVSIFVAYVSTGHLSFLLALPGVNLTPIWPPSGIAFASMLLFGYGVAPAIFLGSLVLNYWFFGELGGYTSLSFFTAFAIASGAVLQTVFGTYLIRRVLNPLSALMRVPDTIRFVAMSSISCIVSSTVGVLSLAVAEMIAWEDLPFSWLIWWAANLGGVLIIGPLALTWHQRHELPFTRAKIAEACLILILLSLGAADAVGDLLPIQDIKYAFTTVQLALVAWAAIRFRERGVTLVVFLLAVIAILGTQSGLGPFAKESQIETLLLLQSYLAIMSVMGLSLSAALNENQRAIEMTQLYIERLEGAEKILRLSTDSVPVLISYVDAAERYQFNNLAYESFLGKKRDEITGRSVREVFGETAYAKISPNIKKALAGERLVVETELAINSAESRTYEVAYIPDHGPDGVVRGFAVLGSDITMRKQQEAERLQVYQREQESRIKLQNLNLELEARVQSRTIELEQYTQRLERSNLELEQFAYVASHDLQEPLRAINYNCQEIAEKYSAELDEEGRECARYAAEGAVRMQNLIQDLLNYSRITRDKVKCDVVNVEEVITQVLDDLAPSIAESGAVIQCGSFPSFHGYRHQITQLFQNLIGNAAKFRRNGSLEISVGSENRNDEVVFFVKDNGIGIDEKHFDRIFLIFQRLHVREKYPGTGVGLSICKKIVERHGGRIWVESAPGKGSSFCFTLPGVSPPENKVSPTQRAA